MYWWDIDALKKELRLGPLPAAMAFRYVLANTLLVTLSAVLPNPADADSTTWIVRVLSVGVTVFGLRHCYHENGAAAGHLFMDRYFAISWVLYVRQVAVFLAVAIGVSALARAAAPEGDRRILYAATGIAWLAVLYWRIGSHIREVARNGRTTTIEGAMPHSDTVEEAQEA
jgi:hypothetical protein